MATQTKWKTVGTVTLNTEPEIFAEIVIHTEEKDRDPCVKIYRRFVNDRGDNYSKQIGRFFGTVPTLEIFANITTQQMEEITDVAIKAMVGDEKPTTTRRSLKRSSTEAPTAYTRLINKMERATLAAMQNPKLIEAIETGDWTDEQFDALSKLYNDRLDTLEAKHRDRKAS